MNIWLSPEEIEDLPTSGAAWDSVLSAANSASVTGANVAHQDSSHDVSTLALALAGVRLNDATLLAKANQSLMGAIDTEKGGRWLAAGRNLGAYILAADILGIRSGPVFEWLSRFYTRTLAHNNQGHQVSFRDAAGNSGSNASAQQLFAYAALSAYLGRKDGLDWSWDAYRRYCGDRTSPHKLSSNSDSWQFDPSDPVGIQDPGATKDGCRMDGAIGNDMSRGSKTYSCNPIFTPYPWVGMMGIVPCAMILHRAGYPAFQIVEKAILRAAEYLMDVRQRTGNNDWYDDSRAAQAKHIINTVYGVDFPCKYPVGAGQTFGFVDWTHPKVGVVIPPVEPPVEPPIDPEEPPVEPPVDPPTEFVDLRLTLTMRAPAAQAESMRALLESATLEVDQ